MQVLLMMSITSTILVGVSVNAIGGYTQTSCTQFYDCLSCTATPNANYGY